MAKKQLNEEEMIGELIKAPILEKYFDDEENFDVNKASNEILSLYNIISVPKQGHFIFNGKYWTDVEKHYIAQLITFEMKMLSKPFYTKQIIEHIEHKKYTELKYINKNRNRLVLNNGTLDLSDWENPIFYKEKYFIDDFTTIHFNYKYDIDSKCPNFDKYLSSTFEGNPENIKTIQEMFGYCLTTNTKHEKIFLLYGEGGSGKSVLIDTLKTLVTDANYASIPMSLLDKSFLRAGLKDKILNFSTEECSKLVKDSAINWLKAISSGDPIEAQFKNKDTFNFKPFCKLVFAMNDLPVIQNFDDALQRRFVIIPFNKKFRGDEIDLELKEGKLHSEMSAILQFALAGLKRLGKQRDFTYSQESKDMLINYRSESNHAERFADIYLGIGKSDIYLKVNAVYEKYKKYCNGNNDIPLTNTEFKKIIKRKFGLSQERNIKKIDGKTEEVYELVYKESENKNALSLAI